jgi:hypothetical protein
MHSAGLGCFKSAGPSSGCLGGGCRKKGVGRNALQCTMFKTRITECARVDLHSLLDAIDQQTSCTQDPAWLESSLCMVREAATG